MAHYSKIIADSVSPHGHRLTTFEICLPRIVLAEFNTHRLFSRNSASSRAIPVEKMIKMALEEPYVPTHWGKNQKGMQAEAELTEDEQFHARAKWLFARDSSVAHAQELLKVGVHKQLTNRLIEAFQWHTVVVSSTEWDNWDHLRDHKDAHPEIQKPAHSMKLLREAQKPELLDFTGWHLPYTTDEDWAEATYLQDQEEKTDIELLKKVSVGRCAAVSYMRQNLQDMIKDTERCGNMLVGGHMSPFEHVARPMTEEELETYRMNHYVFTDGTTADSRKERKVGDELSINGVRKEVKSKKTDFFCGNYNGWIQMRKEIPYESDILGEH
jgi:thymidylate synthase ThyX